MANSHQARDFLVLILNHPALLFGSRGTEVDLFSSTLDVPFLDDLEFCKDSFDIVLSTFCLSFVFKVLRLIVPVDKKINC